MRPTSVALGPLRPTRVALVSHRTPAGGIRAFKWQNRVQRSERDEVGERSGRGFARMHCDNDYAYSITADMRNYWDYDREMIPVIWVLCLLASIYIYVSKMNPEKFSWVPFPLGLGTGTLSVGVEHNNGASGGRWNWDDHKDSAMDAPNFGKFPLGPCLSPKQIAMRLDRFEAARAARDNELSGVEADLAEIKAAAGIAVTCQ